jgi:hypothetical protein
VHIHVRQQQLDVVDDGARARSLLFLDDESQQTVYRLGDGDTLTLEDGLDLLLEDTFNAVQDLLLTELADGNARIEVRRDRTDWLTPLLGLEGFQQGVRHCLHLVVELQARYLQLVVSFLLPRIWLRKIPLLLPIGDRFARQESNLAMVDKRYP